AAFRLGVVGGLAEPCERQPRRRVLRRGGNGSGDVLRGGLIIGGGGSGGGRLQQLIAAAVLQRRPDADSLFAQGLGEAHDVAGDVLARERLRCAGEGPKRGGDKQQRQRQAKHFRHVSPPGVRGLL